MNKRQPLGVTVKDTVDFMYEMLLQHPDGTEFCVTSLGNTPSEVVSVLVARGIIEKTSIFSKYGRKFRYKWVANSKPTNVLYGSITQELRDRQRKLNQHYKNVKKKAAMEETASNDAPVAEPVVERTKEVEVPVVNDLLGNVMSNPLEIYGIDELWAEIKRRGCTIEDNHLVLVKKVVFD